MKRESRMWTSMRNKHGRREKEKTNNVKKVR
jgi:hypothetical protein